LLISGASYKEFPNVVGFSATILVQIVQKVHVARLGLPSLNTLSFHAKIEGDKIKIL